MQTSLRHHTLPGSAQAHKAVRPAQVCSAASQRRRQQRTTCQALPGLESLPALSPQQVQTAAYWGLGLAGGHLRSLAAQGVVIQLHAGFGMRYLALHDAPAELAVVGSVHQAPPSGEMPLQQTRANSNAGEPQRPLLKPICTRFLYDIAGASFVATFFVAPQFKDQFKEDVDWRDIYNTLQVTAVTQHCSSAAAGGTQYANLLHVVLMQAQQ